MRLIDADALMPNAECKGWYDVVTAYDIANAPTIEPEPKKGKWIPVTERLPEKNGNYLITYRLPWKSETGEDRYEVDMDYWQWYTWDDDNDVVAWMPLPEPYEES